ncbi:hypothetical protein EV180_004471 [Coemansia sp. RSA 518]|nr:hypothetical protein IW142_000408 [Coemansia sp. RSA 564]KAJ2185790.1 hypothetical protein EV181_003681 [Coemansia sp. RSA 532]KAJ2220986.1 hypothetical protein IW143_002012 [Coemansia sp. RSA 520]KAJ2221969.1 hypothetical protein EV180_004471 [Coemansia sp. RSA 518]KAJ2264349.1 hypothetical protein J3F81_006259 [Coemansia sp. RSA 371]KAJ2270029.1 hypothetical protein GGH14_005316 [Coemansia sp. RSA 370]KAJ2411103.1 hypothetical protein J3F80_000068 [Coemansia sp. RSA 2526]KAJ2835473.1 hy
MSTYVLRYFPIKARAEVARLLLLASGDKFADVMPDWPAEKENQPLGQLPVLIETLEDGTEFELSDSVAIEKYLARKSGLLVKTGSMDTAREDQLRSQINDVIDMHYAYMFAPEGSHEVIEARYRSNAKAFVKYHEKILAENGSNGHYFGSKTTYMDIALFAFITVIRQPNEKAIKDCTDYFSESNAPGLNKVYETVQASSIAAPYVATLK